MLPVSKDKLSLVFSLVEIFETISHVLKTFEYARRFPVDVVSHRRHIQFLHSIQCPLFDSSQGSSWIGNAPAL